MAGGGDEDGFALLLVLWTLVLVGLLLSTLVLGGRSAAQLGGNQRDAAVLSAAAEGAVSETIFHLLARQWRPDGGPYTIHVGLTPVRIDIVDEAGRVNPNDAPHALLVALLVRLGQDGPAAEKLANAVALWRRRGAASSADAARYQAAGLPFKPGGRGFRSVGELGQVIGMTPTLLDTLAPHLTLQHQGEVNWQAADPVVRAALDDAHKAGLVYAGILPDPDLTVQIRAVAHGTGNGTVQRQATVLIRARPEADTPLYSVFQWQ